MQNEISKVLIDSIAEEVEIEIGDRLVSINGTKVKDIIDYKYLIVDDYVVIEVKKTCGEIWEIEIEKEFGEDIGIEFKDPMLDRPKNCHNKCIFCFIDQLPKGMRETLYFKDDDSRLSFLQGNFITMTNMSEDDIDRIIKYRISPINISVHTTNPDLRCKMMNNRFAGTIYDRLKRITDAKIDVNCQIVLCPEYNDKEELERTVLDLYKLYPYINNLAVVPIGVTKFRNQNGLVQLELFNGKTASEEIDRVAKLQERFIKEVGEPFVRLSDEFYIIAGRDVPDDEFYNGFQQLEDGVGMIRNFRDNIECNLHNVRQDVTGSFTMVTGTSAYEEIRNAANKIMSRNPDIKINVRKIINNFFGETITVAGLLTGQDIIKQLSEDELGDYIIMSDNMFKKGYELGNYEELIMLDDIKVCDLEQKLNRKVIVCDYTGEDLIELINTHTN